MSNRAPKSKPKKPSAKARKTKKQKLLLPFLLGSATLMGGIAAVATFLPRPSISLVDPVDPSNPFSSRFTITNGGFIPLTDVSIGVHSQHIQVGNSRIFSQPRKNGDAATVGTLSRDTWHPLNLGMD